METEILVKFLKHLISCTETVLQKDEIESYDIISLRRELSQLLRHLDGTEKIDSRILKKITGLKIEIDEGLLSDSRKSTWFLVLRLVFHRSALVAAERARRLEQARRQLSQFRDDLDHVRFSLEF